MEIKDNQESYRRTIYKHTVFLDNSSWESKNSKNVYSKSIWKLTCYEINFNNKEMKHLMRANLSFVKRLKMQYNSKTLTKDLSELTNDQQD